MAQVELHINGRPYKIACGEGEEARTTALAAEVDRRIGDLKKQIGNVGDARLLVLASILMADELSEARTQAESKGHSVPEPYQPSLPAGPPASENGTAATTAAIERLAARIERIAESLEAA